MIILVIIIINNNIDAGEMGQPGSIPTVHMKVKGENRTKLSSALHRSVMVHTHPPHTHLTQR